MVNPTSSNLKIDGHGLNGLHSGGLSETGGPGKLMGDDEEAAASFGFKNLSDPTEATVLDGDFGFSLQCIQGIHMSSYIHYVIINVTFGRDGDLHLHVFQAFLVMKLCHKHLEEQKNIKGNLSKTNKH